MNERFAGQKFLFQQLAASAELAAIVDDRVFSNLAPQGSVEPYVTINHYGVRINHPIGWNFRRLFVKPTFIVVGVTSGADDEVTARIASEIDNALTGAKGTITWEGQDYYIQGCGCIDMVQFNNTANGKTYLHEGGIFRLFISPRP